MNDIDRELAKIKKELDDLRKKYGLHYYCLYYNTGYRFRKELYSSPDKENVRPVLLPRNRMPSSSSTDALEAEHFGPLKTTVVNTTNDREVNNFLFNCFDELQQIPCKLLAKQWIRVIEPRKQSRHPYNRGEKSKPYWWPTNARHKEPDHLKKNERISLLIGIVKHFKDRGKELIAAAELIGDVSVDGSALKRQGPMVGRRRTILIDIFRVATSKGECVEVIKPGKKYSSKIYQKNLKKLDERRKETLFNRLMTDSNKLLEESCDAKEVALPDYLLTLPLPESNAQEESHVTTPPNRSILQSSSLLSPFSPSPDSSSSSSKKSNSSSMFLDHTMEYPNLTQPYISPLARMKPVSFTNKDFPLNDISSSFMNEFANIKTSSPSGKKGFNPGHFSGGIENEEAMIQ